MTWQTLILASFTQPREVARALVVWNPPDSARWQAMILLSVISTLMTTVAITLAGPTSLISGEDIGGPFESVAIDLGINLLAVLLVTGIGNLAGGQGRFPDALLLVGWVQFIMLLWQVPQCLALIVVPPLFLPLVSIGIVLLFWLLTQFTTALHGFVSPLRVFFGILAVVFLFGAALTPFMQPMLATTG